MAGALPPQGRAQAGLTYSSAVGGYEAVSNGGGCNSNPNPSGASPYASAKSGGHGAANGGPANGGSAYSSGSGGGRFESGGSEAGVTSYGAALGGRPSLEDVSPPGAGERHSDGGVGALQVSAQPNTGLLLYFLLVMKVRRELRRCA